MDDTTIKNSNSDRGIKPIHTYTSDMADAVRENEASVIKIALAEKDKREQEELYKKAEGTGTSKFFLVLGGIILIGGAIVGSYFLFKKSSVSQSPSATAVKEISTLISYDEKVLVDVTENKNQSDLANSIKKEVENVGKARSIKSIFLTEKTSTRVQILPLSNLLFLMNTTAPSALTRTLGDAYMIGSYTDNSASPKSHLFVMLTIKDYNQAYASTLEWEKTMLNDFFLMFNTDVSGSRSGLFEKQWGDIIIDNKDARILYDNAGNDVLYYEFANKETFIITDSKEAIRELNIRLLSKNTKPL